jgi:hypothetical protein
MAQGRGIIGRHQHAGAAIIDDLGNRARGRADQRRAHGHGLGHGIAEALVARGQHHHASPGNVRSQVPGRRPWLEAHAIAQAAGAGERAQRGFVVTATDHQERRCAIHACQRFDQGVHALVRGQPAEEQQRRIGRRCPGRVEERRRDAVGHHGDDLGAEIEGALHGIRSAAAGRAHAVCRAQGHAEQRILGVEQPQRRAPGLAPPGPALEHCLWIPGKARCHHQAGRSPPERASEQRALFALGVHGIDGRLLAQPRDRARHRERAEGPERRVASRLHVEQGRPVDAVRRRHVGLDALARRARVDHVHVVARMRQGRRELVRRALAAAAVRRPRREVAGQDDAHGFIPCADSANTRCGG